jgi:hypothetical protein
MPASSSPLSSIERLLSLLQGKIEVRLSAFNIIDPTTLQKFLASSSGITPQSVKVMVLKNQLDLVSAYRHGLVNFTHQLAGELKSQKDDQSPKSSFSPVYKTTDKILFFHSPWNTEFTNFLVSQFWFGQASSCPGLVDQLLLHRIQTCRLSDHQNEFYYESTLPTPLLTDLHIYLRANFSLTPDGREEVGDLYFFLTNLTPQIQLAIARNPLPNVKPVWNS